MMRLIAITLLASLASCGTMFGPGPDYVPVSSDPLGAKVYVDGSLAGETPTTVTVQRGQPGQLRLKLKGYRTAEKKIPTVFNGPAALTIPLTLVAWPLGIVSLAVDIGTGNMEKHSENPISIHLTPIKEES